MRALQYISVALLFSLGLAGHSGAQEAFPASQSSHPHQQKHPQKARRVWTNDDLRTEPPRQEFAPLHFRLMVPEGWGAPDLLGPRLLIPCPGVDDFRVCTIAVELFPFVQGAWPNDYSLLEEHRQRTLRVKGFHEAGPYRELRVADFPASEHVLDITGKKTEQAKMVYVLVASHRRLYFLTLRARPALFEEQLPTFDKVVASFEPILDSADDAKER